MNRPLTARIAYSACPHDCPSTCALEVEVLDARTIGRVRGARDNDYTAGAGRLAGPDPREMARSDLIVIWGTNAVATQVNVMTHAVRARKERGARIAVVDVYHNETMKQADIAICLKPGTDGAFACA